MNFCRAQIEVSRVVPKSRPSFAARAAFAALTAFGVVVFTALGVWQLERRVWKLDLIRTVDARVHASAVAAPGPVVWPSLTTAKDEYLRVRVQGVFLNDRETLVKALTKFGGGFWVMTPFRDDRGFVVLVNRGFVPRDLRSAGDRAKDQIDGETIVTGLLRTTEPNGAFLRSNDSARDLWYSRDVAAIAKARGLTNVAPYFIDADAGARAIPRGGLTVISFPNNHLVYALTWFGMALTVVGMTVLGVRQDKKQA
jgi:surfeit locus 1 family protein